MGMLALGTTTGEELGSGTCSTEVTFHRIGSKSWLLNSVLTNVESVQFSWPSVGLLLSFCVFTHVFIFTTFGTDHSRPTTGSPEQRLTFSPSAFDLTHCFLSGEGNEGILSPDPWAVSQEASFRRCLSHPRAPRLSPAQPTSPIPGCCTAWSPHTVTEMRSVHPPSEASLPSGPGSMALKWPI